MGFFPLSCLPLTHCLHSNADCTHKQTHIITQAYFQSSSGHGSILSDSSACAAVTSVDSTVCMHVCVQS